MLLRSLGVVSILLLIGAIGVLLSSFSGSGGPDSGMASGIMFFGIVALAAVLAAVACIGSFFASRPDGLTKLLTRGPIVAIAALVALLLGGGLLV